MVSYQASLLKGKSGLWVPASTNEKAPILTGAVDIPMDLIAYAVEKGLPVYDEELNQHCVRLTLAYWEYSRRSPRSPHYKGCVYLCRGDAEANYLPNQRTDVPVNLHRTQQC